MDDRVELRREFRSALKAMCINAPDGHLDSIKDDAIERYLTARNDDMRQALDLAKTAEEWRADIQPWTITPADIPVAIRSGCWRFAGFALDGRPILLVKVSLWRPRDYTLDEYVRYIAYMQENNIARIHVDPATGTPRATKGIVMFDMGGFSVFQNDLRMIQKLIQINQTCYCERLSLAVVFNAPRAFVGLWGIIKAWIDQRTAQKVHLFAASDFDKAAAFLGKIISPQVLMAEYGGERRRDWPCPPEIEDDGGVSGGGAGSGGGGGGGPGAPQDPAGQGTRRPTGGAGGGNGVVYGPGSALGVPRSRSPRRSPRAPFSRKGPAAEQPRARSLDKASRKRRTGGGGRGRGGAGASRCGGGSGSAVGAACRFVATAVGAYLGLFLLLLLAALGVARAARLAEQLGWDLAWEPALR